LKLKTGLVGSVELGIGKSPFFCYLIEKISGVWFYILFWRSAWIG